MMHFGAVLTAKLLLQLAITVKKFKSADRWVAAYAASFWIWL